jgi:hypothetical protein
MKNCSGANGCSYEFDRSPTQKLSLLGIAVSCRHSWKRPSMSQSGHLITDIAVCRDRTSQRTITAYASLCRLDAICYLCRQLRGHDRTCPSIAGNGLWRSEIRGARHAPHSSTGIDNATEPDPDTGIRRSATGIPCLAPHRCRTEYLAILD